MACSGLMAESARLLDNASGRFACNTFATVFNPPRYQRSAHCSLQKTAQVSSKTKYTQMDKSRRMNLYKFPASSKRGQPYTPLRTRSRRMSVIRTSHTSLEAKPRQMSVIRVQHFVLATKDRISKLENKKHANGQKSRRIPTTISLSLSI